MNNYQVLFSGEVSPQANRDIVRAKLACELDIDDRKAAQLFSGRTVVIKSQLSHRQAIELQAHLASLGAVCRVKDLTPQHDNNVADFRVDRSGKSDATLRDITAAHTECPRCGHMQLEATHCTRCGVDIAAAVRQRQKEDLIIEKKIRELRAKQDGQMSRRGGAMPGRPNLGGASSTVKSRGSWFRKSS
jgi:ribosomal protein L37E